MPRYWQQIAAVEYVVGVLHFSSVSFCRFLELEVGKSSLILEGLEGEDLKNHNLRIYVEGKVLQLFITFVLINECLILCNIFIIIIDVMLKPHPSKTMFGLKQAHVDAKVVVVWFILLL